DANSGELRIEAGRGPFGRNAYWCEHLVEYAGRKVAVHYDPENLSAGVHVYTLDGRYLFAADHIPRAAFNSTAAGREHSKLRRRVSKQHKDMAANETRIAALERAQIYQHSRPAPAPEPAPPAVDTNVVPGVFQRVADPERDAQRMQRTGTDDARETKFADLMARMAARHNAEVGF